MKYPEYLYSAQRHKYACNTLLEQINALSSDEDKLTEYESLHLTLYYLSGYIIECSLKFKLFELLGYDPQAEVDKDGCDLIGVDYKKQIKTHNFQVLQNNLDSQIGDFKHTSNKKEINKLLQDWSPEIRYSHISVDYDNVREFYDHSKEFLRKVK